MGCHCHDLPRLHGGRSRLVFRRLPKNDRRHSSIERWKHESRPGASRSGPEARSGDAKRRRDGSCRVVHKGRALLDGPCIVCRPVPQRKLNVGVCRDGVGSDDLRRSWLDEHRVVGGHFGEDDPSYGRLAGPPAAHEDDPGTRERHPIENRESKLMPGKKMRRGRRQERA